MGIDSICREIIRRSRTLFGLIQAVQGTIDEVDLHYSADEDATPSQAVTRYLWTRTLPETEPGTLAAGDHFIFVLADGELSGVPHTWITTKITDRDYEDIYRTIIDPYFPGSVPQVVLLDTESPILKLYCPRKYYAVGEGPE